MQASSTPSPGPAAIANDAWTKLFNSGPYTTFNMLHYLLQRKTVTWDRYLQDPTILQTIAKQEMVALEMAKQKVKPKDQPAFTAKYLKKLTKAEVETFMRQDIENDKGPYPNHFNTTWNLKTGRCTSFALGVVDWLERMTPPSFPGYWDFRFYDLNGHRVARCQRTGLLVDSSSSRGAIVLPEDGEWLTFDGSEQSWKWSKGESKFHPGGANKKTIKSSTTLVRDNCMAICLTEVALKGDLLCYFRSFSNNTAQYHGMLKWKFTQKRLELSNKFINKYIFHFGPDKAKIRKPITQARFTEVLSEFIELYGGPHGFLQWNSGSIQTINWDIWAAAVRVWGFPVEEKVG